MSTLIVIVAVASVCNSILLAIIGLSLSAGQDKARLRQAAGTLAIVEALGQNTKSVLESTVLTIKAADVNTDVLLAGIRGKA